MGEFDVHESRGRRRGDIQAWMQAEQAEGSRRLGRKRPVGPGEDGSDLGVLLIGGEAVQAVALDRQFFHQVRHAEMTVGRGAVCGNPQCQRQPAAQLG